MLTNSLDPDEMVSIYTKVPSTLYLQVFSAEFLCKQFEPRSGLAKCQARSGFKLFDTDGISESFFFGNSYEPQMFFVCFWFERLPNVQSLKFIFNLSDSANKHFRS